MDEKSKVKIMLFFNSLKKNMDIFEEENFRREGRMYAKNGYFHAVDKMNHFIQDFISKEIEDDGSS